MAVRGEVVDIFPILFYYIIHRIIFSFRCLAGAVILQIPAQWNTDTVCMRICGKMFF